MKYICGHNSSCIMINKLLISFKIRIFKLFHYRNRTNNTNNNILKSINLTKKLELYGYGFMPEIPSQVIAQLRNHYFSQFPSTINENKNIISIMHPDIKIRNNCHHEIIRLIKPYLDKHLCNYKIILATYFAKPLCKNSFVGFHQDPTFTDPSLYDDFSIWIPLDNISKGDGELVIIPNSNNYFNKVNYYTYRPLYLNSLSENEGKCITMKAGHPVIFYNRTVHCSKPNLKKQIRIAISIKVTHANAGIYSYYQSEQDGKAERYIQPEDFYLKSEWDEKKRPDNNKFDVMVDVL
jgi:hypothetical protein